MKDQIYFIYQEQLQKEAEKENNYTFFLRESECRGR